MSVSNVASICSLLISVVALAVSVVAAIRTARLATAQTRTELLTKLYYAQVEYEHFNRRIGELKLNPPDPLPPELRALFDSEAGFKNSRRIPRGIARHCSGRNAISTPKRFLPFDIIQMQSQSESKTTTDVLKRLSLYPAGPRPTRRQGRHEPASPLRLRPSLPHVGASAYRRAPDAAAISDRRLAGGHAACGTPTSSRRRSGR
jgi:hypothetical protein